MSSVTRFGEIFISLSQFLKGLFSIWQNSEPALANFMCYWAKVYCCKGPNIERINKPSGHTGHEQVKEAVNLNKRLEKPHVTASAQRDLIGRIIALWTTI